MINISQHCFVPRTRTTIGWYSLSGILQTQTTGSSSTTLRQYKDVYNSYQLFGNYVPSNYYVLRLFGRDGVSQSEGSVVGLGSTSNYQSPLLSVGNRHWFNSSAFTFATARYSNGFPVLCLMWYEKPSPVLGLLLGNVLNSDALSDDLDEKIEESKKVTEEIESLLGESQDSPKK